MKHTTIRVLGLVSAVLFAACGTNNNAADRSERATTSIGARDSVMKDSLARVRQDSINRTLPGYVVDSILPVEEQLRRFRAMVGGAPVTTFRNGSMSRDALVQRFMRAVVAADSNQLRAMAVDAREFADLIYPESPSTKPPYQQDPALVWRTIQNPSASGLKRLVRRAGGVPVRLASYKCEAAAAKQGRNILWSGCFLTLIGEKGDTSTHRFFGTIVEREGRFKFMSYKNEF